MNTTSGDPLYDAYAAVCGHSGAQLIFTLVTLLLVICLCGVPTVYFFRLAWSVPIP